MAFGDALSPATGMIKDSTVGFVTNYGWVLWVLFGFAVVAGIIGIVVMIVSKKKQWTHELKIERVMPNGQMMEGHEIIKMRRYPLIRTAEVFELETPLIGSYLIAELDRYTGKNQYSIILDANNRIYTPLERRFVPDKNSINVSARHSEVDISLGDFKQKYQEVHKTKKRVEWAEIAKYAAFTILIIAAMIVAIKGIEAWGNSQTDKANADQAFAAAMTELSEASENFEEYGNTQLLIIDELNELKGTSNLQSSIKELKK